MTIVVAEKASLESLLRSLRGEIVDARLAYPEVLHLDCRLGGGSVFAVQPAEQEADDDPCNWELITPGGVALEYAPGSRRQISDANVPAIGRNSH